ncbi:MAG: ATP-binding protein [bacterium]
MNIFQNVRYKAKQDTLRNILAQIENRFKAKEVYYLEFDEHSSFCINHLGVDRDCSSFHKNIVDRLERVCYEENIPIVVLDTTKDPRTINTHLSSQMLSILVVPVKFNNLCIGTLTVIRDKKFDIKDLNELISWADNIGVLMSSKLHSFDINEIVKDISGWIIQNVGQDRFDVGEFINFISALGIDLRVAFLFQEEKSYGNLPCEINNWEALLEVCPAVKKNYSVNCSSCRFSKVKGYICSRLGNQIPFGVFSLSDLSSEFEDKWNEIFISLFSKMALFYHGSKKLLDSYIFRRILAIINELLPDNKFTIDNVIVKVIDIIFDVSNCAAVYVYSSKSRSRFELIKINPKYQKFSNLIYNYSYHKLNDLDLPSSVNFNGTFCFFIKYASECIVFDIIFINDSRSNSNVSENIHRQIGILKNFLEFVCILNSIFDNYKSELRHKRDEVKGLYSKIRKLEQEIHSYQEKMIALENKVNYAKNRDEFLKYIYSLSSFNDFENKFSMLVRILDSFITYRVNSAVCIVYNKIISRFERITFYSIPDYLQDKVRVTFGEVLTKFSPSIITNFLSNFNLIHKGDQEFQTISDFFVDFQRTNIKSILTIPLTLSDEKIGSLILLFNSRIELNNEEKNFLLFIGKELSRRLRILKNQEILEKLRQIYALIQDFLDKLHFQNSLTIEQLFEYIYLILSKLEFNTLVVYRDKKDFIIKNWVEFKLEYAKSNLKHDLPSTISLPREVLLSLNKVMIFERDKIYDDKFSFINYFFADNANLVFVIPFSDAKYWQFSQEYANLIAVAFSDNLAYSFFDIQILTLVQKMISMVYNNMFLYYINTKDKRILFEVFEVMDDGIIVMDLEKRVLLINNSALDILQVNYSAEDIVSRGMRINELIADKTGDLVQKIINIDDLIEIYLSSNQKTSVVGEATIDYEDISKIIRYNFSLLTFPIITNGFLTEQQENYNYLVVLKDITHQRNLEKEKDDFVATVSHDIKTPLTTMKGYLSALLRYSDKITDDQRDSYLRVINSEIDRINRMLNNLMDLRKLEINILKINPVKFDIIKVINKVVEIFKISYINFDFEINTKDQSVIVFADKDKIEQVLHNLLSNAVKYSPVGGKITISVEQLDKEVIVSVSDQGVGIPPSEIDKIFEKYYRTKETQKKKISGKGLGLYITKKIIELHKGKVFVKSELNKGTTFSFSLPL